MTTNGTVTYGTDEATGLIIHTMPARSRGYGYVALFWTTDEWVRNQCPNRFYLGGEREGIMNSADAWKSAAAALRQAQAWFRA